MKSEGNYWLILSEILQPICLWMLVSLYWLIVNNVLLLWVKMVVKMLWRPRWAYFFKQIFHNTYYVLIILKTRGNILWTHVHAAILLQTMLILWWSSLRSPLRAIKHAKSLHVESTDTPHEGFLHRLLVAFSLKSQSLNLDLGLLYSLTVLQGWAEHRQMHLMWK